MSVLGSLRQVNKLSGEVQSSLPLHPDFVMMDVGRVMLL